MYTSAFDKMTLNNGYQMPPMCVCPAYPKDEDLELYNDDSLKEYFRKEIQFLMECGYRSFDTCMRGGTEEVLGEMFRETKIPREKLFLTTKVYHSNHGYSKTLRYVDDTLKRTKLDYIDLFLIHCPVTYRGLYVETFKALTELYHEGVIKAVGVSNFSVQHFYDLEQVTDIVPAVNQREQHPFYVRHDLIAYEKKHQIISQSYCPLGHGKYSRDKRLEWIARRHGKSVSQVILRWHIQKGFMTVTRSTSHKHTIDNINIFDFALSAEEMAYIETLNRGDRIWHDAVRFPGSCFYEPTQKAFYEAIARKAKEYCRTRNEWEVLEEKLSTLIESEDVDGTKDCVIYCFTRAVEKYGRNPAIPEQAIQEAELLADEWVRMLLNE